MSFLVTMARAHYYDKRIHRVIRLQPRECSRHRWMSQLAYDTDDRPKVESVLDAWGFGLRAFVTNNPINGFPLGNACAVVAGGRAANIVSLPVPIRSR